MSKKYTNGLVSKSINAINECIDNNLEDWELVESGGACILKQKQMMGKLMSSVMQSTHGHLSPKLADKIIKAEISIDSTIFGV